jgi:hypothetical protein
MPAHNTDRLRRSVIQRKLASPNSVGIVQIISQIWASIVILVDYRRRDNDDEWLYDDKLLKRSVLCLHKNDG